MADDLKDKPKFGDLVENGWASEDNPTRRGFFVREIRSGARRTWEITDGKGKFWRCPLDHDHKLTWAPTSRPAAPSTSGADEREEIARRVGALMPKLTKAQANMADWLSREEWSAYGECRGADLDFLVASGLAEYAHQPPTDRTGVRLTDAGRAALKGPGPGEAVADGWVMVPREPTPEMKSAAWDAYSPITQSKIGTVAMMTNVYRAMIAATPTREGDVLTPEGRAALSNQKTGEA